MKTFRFLFVALVAMLGFNACSKDCGHDFIEVDYSKALVGTWTLVNGDFAEAWVVKEGGLVEVTGVLDGAYYETKGIIKLKNNKISYKFDDGSEFEGILDIIPGKCFSMSYAWDYESDCRMVYQYCDNNLADEIVGMWVCNEGLTGGVTIMSYADNGKLTVTSAAALGTNNPLVKQESEYVVVGDLVFMKLAAANAGGQPMYTAARMIYTPNGTSAGDIMTHKKYIPFGDNMKESVMSFLRIKQTLDLADNKYDYIKTFVSNVKGEDKDIPFLNTSFNFAKMDGAIIDKFLKSTLFSVEFPNANTFKCSFLAEGRNGSITAPIEVQGNKMTIKMSKTDSAYQDVDVYTFQDQDNTQMHMYMPTSSFEKFFANTAVAILLENGQLNKNDTEAIAGVYKTIADAVESINLSLVMSKTK